MRRLSFIWPVLIMAAAILWILYAIGSLTGPLVDLVVRSWPILLVASGLILLIGRRVRFGNLLSLILSAALIGGVMSVALGRQSDQLVTENQKSFAQNVDPQIANVTLNVTTLNTQVDIVSGTEATIKADFAGSRQSTLNSDFKADGANGTFTLIESRDTTPSLQASGRGKLTITLPSSPTLTQMSLIINGDAGDITVNAAASVLDELTVQSKTGKIILTGLPQKITTLNIAAAGDLDLGTLPANLANLNLNLPSGAVTFDATNTPLKNLTLTTGAGNVDLKLTQQSGLIALIKTPGEVTVTIPESIAANIQLVNGAANDVVFNQNDYILNIEKMLVSRRSSDPQMNVKIDAAKATIQ